MCLIIPTHICDYFFIIILLTDDNVLWTLLLEDHVQLTPIVQCHKMYYTRVSTKFRSIYTHNIITHTVCNTPSSLLMQICLISMIILLCIFVHSSQDLQKELTALFALQLPHNMHNNYYYYTFGYCPRQTTIDTKRSFWDAENLSLPWKWLLRYFLVAWAD